MSDSIPLGDVAGPIRAVDPAVFVRRIAPDCLSFQCALVSTGETHLDACCQYGVDADLGERDRILSARARIAPFLDPDRRDLPWFRTRTSRDSDFPSGRSVRTTVVGSRCVFLAHGGERGCVLHRAALATGEDPARVKPHVCSLFPLTYGEGVLCFSDDYPDYTCSHAGERAYRLQRPVIRTLFGDPLVRALDRAEASVLRGTPSTRSSPGPNA